MFSWTIANIVGIIQIAVFLIGGLAFFFAMRNDIRMLRHDLQHMEQRQTVLDEKLADVTAKLDMQIDTLGREFGETAQSIRQKVTEVEIYVRDNFVRKETFGPLMTKLEGDVRGVGDRIEARLLRMEAKIDSK